MRIVALVAATSALLAADIGRAAAQERFFDSDGVRIRYFDQGTGDAVVLLHGNGSWVETMWGDSGVIENLSKHYRVLALDCRGFGKSGKPHDPSAYGANMGDDVVRLLDHLDIRQAHVVGYSMGARITSWLIVNHPSRLISATLGASTYYIDTPEQRQTFEASARQAAAGNYAERLQREYGMTAAQAAERVAMNDPLARAAVYRGNPGLFISESALSETKIPVLHIIGSLDTSRLPASYHLKENVLPAAEFLIIDGATHTGPEGLWRRKEFLEAIQRFIGAHRSSQSDE